jgi:hypothetical protein
MTTPKPDNVLDQTDQALWSDEALEKAAGGSSLVQTYPQTCAHQRTVVAAD